MSVATQSLFISKEMKALASPTTVAMEKSVSCLSRKGTSRQGPCFCISGFIEKEWRAGAPSEPLWQVIFGGAEVCVCENTVYSGPSCNLQIETNNSGDICNYGKRLFTEREKTD